MSKDCACAGLFLVIWRWIVFSSALSRSVHHGAHGFSFGRRIGIIGSNDPGFDTILRSLPKDKEGLSLAITTFFGLDLWEGTLDQEYAFFNRRRFLMLTNDASIGQRYLLLIVVINIWRNITRSGGHDF